MQPVFKRALFHREPVVLKRQLLPLCCGHVMTLMVAENAYVTPGEIPTLLSLALAVGICSRTHEDAEAWIKSDNLLEDTKRWGRKCRKLDFTMEGARFEQYLRDFSIFPARWSKSRNPQPTRHPWPLLVATSIMPIVGESRAWNMPLPKAVSIWSAMDELDGDTSLKTDWEIEALEQLKKQAEAQEEKVNK